MEGVITDPAQLATAVAAIAPQFDRATMKTAFLVAPSGFRMARESAQDNAYMDLSVSVDKDLALRQHRDLSEALMAIGLPTIVFPGLREAPDGVFPNNAFATIDGTFIVGSMRHQVRRFETGRDDLRKFFGRLLGYELIDLSDLPVVAELTGPLVIDRARNIGFCGMSERVDDAGVAAMHQAFQLNATFKFDLQPNEYHTNVVMAVLAGRALVIAPQALADPTAAAAIKAVYGDAVIELDDSERQGFVGNCIAVTDRDVFMSAHAVDCMRPQTRAHFESLGFTVHGVEVGELEKAGGSVRCMIAEIY